MCIYVYLGLFAYSHMDFEADRESTPTGDPSLADMTRTAINILQKNPKGFFLFVEGLLSLFLFLNFHQTVSRIHIRKLLSDIT